MHMQTMPQWQKRNRAVLRRIPSTQTLLHENLLIPVLGMRIPEDFSSAPLGKIYNV